MSCMNKRTQVRGAFAAAAIALLICEVSGGWGLGSILGKGERKAEAADFKASTNPAATEDYSVSDEVASANLIEINIVRTGVVFKNRSMSFEELDTHLGSLIASSKERHEVVVYCMLDSVHGDLIRVLDVCYKYKLKDVHVLSL